MHWISCSAAEVWGQSGLQRHPARSKFRFSSMVRRRLECGGIKRCARRHDDKLWRIVAYSRTVGVDSRGKGRSGRDKSPQMDTPLWARRSWKALGRVFSCCRWPLTPARRRAVITSVQVRRREACGKRTEFDPPPVAQTHKLHRTLRLADLTIPVDLSPRTDQFGVHTPWTARAVSGHFNPPPWAAGEGTETRQRWTIDNDRRPLIRSAARTEAPGQLNTIITICQRALGSNNTISLYYVVAE